MKTVNLPPLEVVTKGSYWSLSNLVTNDDFEESEAFKKMIDKERPMAMIWTFMFILLSPLVFRYAMYSSSNAVEFNQKMYQMDNGTIDTITDWKCEECNGVKGITLQNLQVNTWNVTNPNFQSGFPGIAVFVSQDLEYW